MKVSLILILSFSFQISIGQVSVNAKKYSSPQIEVKNYIGKTVGQLLLNDTIKQFIKYEWTVKPSGLLDALVLLYPRNKALVIYVNPLRFTPDTSKTKQFDLELYKKEKITDLRYLLTAITDEY